MATPQNPAAGIEKDANALRAQGIPFPEYFSALAATYVKQTGNATRDAFAASLPDITALVPITSDSRIHDSAAGPATATSALLKAVPKGLLGAESVLVTDNNPAMVAAAREAFPTIDVREMDSEGLEVPDGAFSHSILSFSIFNMGDPLKCIQEMRRTVKEGGVAAILTWRRFGAGEVIAAAQRMVRPALPAMAIPHKEFMDEGVLEELVVKSGFDKAKVAVKSEKHVVMGENLAGVREFCLGDHSKPARSGWSQEEAARWPEVVDRAFQAEVEAHGGVLFEYWVILAKK